MKRSSKLLFLAILILAAGLRLWHLWDSPPGLNWDEISHGYNAYSLLKTGRDQWNQPWPMFNFRAYGDYPTAGNLYLTIPFVALLGLNAFSIRLPAAILGIIFVAVIYFFIKLVFKKEKLALIAMFLAAVSPWTLFPSRAVFQSNLSQLLLLLGFYFFFKCLKNPKLLTWSVLAFSLSTYTYHNARIIAPLTLLTLLVFYHRQIIAIVKKHRPTAAISLIIILLVLLPNLINLFSPTSLARNRWVGIINPNSINLINESRRLYEGPEFLNIVVNNKVVYFVKTLAVNYFNLLNPIPLFFRGSQNFQFNPPQTGLLLAAVLPFFYLGLLTLVFRFTADPKSFLILILFLLSLLPAALTTGDFPSIRATSALPFYFLIIIFGFNLLKPRLLKIILILTVIASLVQLFSYINTYLAYNREYSAAWQYGYQQTIDFVKPIYDQYDQIVFTKKYGEPHEFVLFYWPWDPKLYLADPHFKSDFHSDWYWVDGFDKFKFINDWDIKNYSYSPKTLLVTSPNNFPETGFFPLQTINFLNGNPAFEILKND